MAHVLEAHTIITIHEAEIADKSDKKCGVLGD
jgi:hypothetical protein